MEDAEDEDDAAEDDVAEDNENANGDANNDNELIKESKEPIKDIGFDEYSIHNDRTVNTNSEDKLIITLTNNISLNGYDRDDERETDEKENDEDTSVESISEKAFEIVKVSSINNESGNETGNEKGISTEPISPTQSVEELEKELEEALETIKESQQEPTDESSFSTSLSLVKSKPRQLPLRIVPLNIRNEIIRQSKNTSKILPKKTDAFF